MTNENLLAELTNYIYEVDASDGSTEYRIGHKALKEIQSFREQIQRECEEKRTKNAKVVRVVKYEPKPYTDFDIEVNF